MCFRATLTEERFMGVKIQGSSFGVCHRIVRETFPIRDYKVGRHGLCCVGELFFFNKE